MRALFGIRCVFVCFARGAAGVPGGYPFLSLKGGGRCPKARCSHHEVGGCRCAWHAGSQAGAWEGGY